jgi:trk system potassium uptake protein TrkH
MINTKPILLVVGALISLLSVAMIIPALLDYYSGDPNYSSFINASFITAFFGISLLIANKSTKADESNKNLDIKTAFLLTTISWISMVFFASLPLAFSGVGQSYTDAFFEAMSGLTTTGATIIPNLVDQPKSVLLWRALLQWIGGIGIIVMAMSILPLLKIGGMQLFRTESSDKAEKIMPRTTQIAGAIASIYLIFTFFFCILLWSYADLGWFDAIVHSMTSVASGGYSNYDKSIGAFESVKVEFILIGAMLVSAIPFVLWIRAFGGKWQSLFHDRQVKFFLSVVIISVICCTSWLVYNFDMSFDDAFRKSSFNIISIATTTGYATSNYYHWGSFIVIFIYLLSVMGACTGSTTGGIKVFRYIILLENAKAQIYRLVQPHGVFKPKFNNQPISDEATSSVLCYIVLFAICFCIVAVTLSLTGLDYTTSLSGAAATLANVGPGLGDIIGPAGNYSSLNDFAKWVCAIAMLIGRLEIFTILVILTPYYWKN